MKTLIALTFMLFSSQAPAQTSTDVTAPVILQKAEMFAKKYSDLAKKKDNDLPFSCNEKTARDEARDVLANLKRLDGIALNAQDRCHQRRLESKVHGLIGRLFRDADEGATSFTILKAGMATFPNCTEIVQAYVSTVADFTQIGKLKRGIVMSAMKIKLDQEVPMAKAKLLALPALGVPATEIQRLGSILGKY